MRPNGGWEKKGVPPLPDKEKVDPLIKRKGEEDGWTVQARKKGQYESRRQCDCLPHERGGEDIIRSWISLFGERRIASLRDVGQTPSRREGKPSESAKSDNAPLGDNDRGKEGDHKPTPLVNQEG